MSARFAGGLGKVGVIGLGYVGLPLVRSMADLAIICTDHDAVDYALLIEYCSVVIDTRNICARRGLTSDRVVKA